VADDGHLVGYSDAGGVNGLEHAEGDEVIGAEHGGGSLRKAEEPGRRVAASGDIEVVDVEHSYRAGGKPGFGDRFADAFEAVVALGQLHRSVDEETPTVAERKAMTGSEAAAYPSGREPVARAATGGYAAPNLFALTGGRRTLTGLATRHLPVTASTGTGIDAVAGRPRRGSAPLVSAEELAILRHVAEELPIDSVAQRVGTSPRTVRRRMSNLCDRIGATCAIQAVVWAVHRGLV
jgi:DNA-binding CsgD family transcriptional regulator